MGIKLAKSFIGVIVLLLTISMIGGSVYAANSMHDIVIKSSSNFVTQPSTIQTKNIYVSINGNDNNNGLTTGKAKRTIQNAINTAKSGDIIKIAPGTYKENIKINKSIQIIGNNLSTTIINGNQKTSCIKILEGFRVTIKGLTITNGKGSVMGGGINNEGILNLNTVKITTNTAEHYGGGIFNDGKLIMINSTITNNNASIGGGIMTQNEMEIYKSTISANTAELGGGIHNDGSELSVSSSVLTKNIANTGGAIYNNGGILNLYNIVKIMDNHASTGGGIGNYGLIYMYSSKITNNIATKYGGGIYNYATVYGDNNSSLTANRPDDIKGDPIKPFPTG